MRNPRRQRFLTYFQTVLKGDRGKLAQKTRLTKGRLSQLFDEKEPFGELAAMRLADRLGLAPDYFERDPPTTAEQAMEQINEKIGRIPALPSDALAIAQEFDQIPGGRRRRDAYGQILDIISEAIEPTPKAEADTPDAASPKRARRAHR